MRIPGWPFKAEPPPNAAALADWFSVRVRWWREQMEKGEASQECLEEVAREVNAKDAQEHPERFVYWYMRTVVDGVRRWNDHHGVTGQPIWDDPIELVSEIFFARFDVRLSELLDFLRRQVAPPSSGPWSEPDTPARWAKRFNMSWDALRLRLEDGTIRNKKLSPRSYQIHVDDVPRPKPA